MFATAFYKVRGSRFEEFKNLTVNIARFFMPVGGSLPRAGFNKMRGITTAHVQYKHHAWLNLYLKPKIFVFNLFLCELCDLCDLCGK